MDPNDDIHERKTREIETINTKIAALRRDLQTHQWNSADLQASVTEENDPQGRLTLRDGQYQQYIQDILIELRELREKKEVISTDLVGINRLRHSTSHYLPIPISNQPAPAFSDIKIAEVRKYCSATAMGPQNIKEILEKLFTYGATLHFDDDCYKYVLPTLLTGTMYEEYQTIKGKSLDEIVTHFLARYYVGETPTMALAKIARFKRNVTESITAAISRYRLLQQKAHTMFIGTKVEDPMQMMEVLLRSVGPKTRAMVEQLQINSLTKGEPVSFEALLNYASTTEQIMREYITNEDADAGDQPSVQNVWLPQLMETLYLNNVDLPDMDHRESINALRAPQRLDPSANHTYRLRDKLHQSVKDNRGMSRQSRFDEARMGYKSRDSSRERPKSRDPSPISVKQQQHKINVQQQQNAAINAQRAPTPSRAPATYQPQPQPQLQTQLQPQLPTVTAQLPQQAGTFYSGYNQPGSVSGNMDMNSQHIQQQLTTPTYQQQQYRGNQFTPGGYRGNGQNRYSNNGRNSYGYQGQKRYDYQNQDQDSRGPQQNWRDNRGYNDNRNSTQNYGGSQQPWRENQGYNRGRNSGSDFRGKPPPWRENQGSNRGRNQGYRNDNNWNGPRNSNPGGYRGSSSYDNYRDYRTPISYLPVEGSTVSLGFKLESNQCTKCGFSLNQQGQKEYEKGGHNDSQCRMYRWWNHLHCEQCKRLGVMANHYEGYCKRTPKDQGNY